MEFLIIFVIAIIILAIAIVGLLWSRASGRLRRKGGDRQEYQRPPYGTPGHHGGTPR